MYHSNLGSPGPNLVLEYIFLNSSNTLQFSKGDTNFGTNAEIPVIVAGTLEISNIKIKQIAYVVLRN